MKEKSTYFEFASGEKTHVRLRGDWVMDNADAILSGMEAFPSESVQSIDASNVAHMDMWGALQVQKLVERTRGGIVLNDRQKALFDFLPRDAEGGRIARQSFSVPDIFKKIGKGTESFVRTAYDIFSFIGEIGFCFARNIIHPRGFRFHAIIRHIEETGLRALPIISLLAVLISMVISYQAATQLRKFGANIFTIDLTVISLLREMGVLVTAIMVAGRSGSAFAAEIGVMKLREEIDALKTMGFDPVELLVLPRLIAMMITLPLLTFLADFAGLAGSAVISMLLLDIPFYQYIDRVEMVANPTMFFVGLIKAPVFAFIITVIGCYQGMNVSGSAESVGKLTTVAVVQSIFVVIMIDALFSILFSNMGI